MKSILKYLYILSIYLKFRGVIISPLAVFNRKTLFERANKVHRGAIVSNSDVGYGTYIGENSQLANCKIGRYCSIGSNIKVISATHPTQNFVSTSPMVLVLLNKRVKHIVKLANSMNSCWWKIGVL